MALDITKNSVKFYDYEFVKEDSIKKSTCKNLQYFSDSEQHISRKINSFENKSYFSFGYDYFVISSTDKMDWKLENDTKNIQTYQLQKATTSFGGRNWIAWFSSEIPFQEGPYKFRGLSGLIFEIYDTENIFHYTLIKSKNIAKTYDTTSFLETRYGKKSIPITLKQYQKIKLDYYNNIIEDLNKFRENGGSIASEKEANSKEDLMKQKKEMQQSIKTYYLPIETDKSIPYPRD
jgi:GLPGLI family protein